MLSAQTGKGVEKLMPAVQQQYELWNARIGTSKLNRWLGEVIDRHPPPADKGRPVRLRYITQAKSRPPTFVSFSSRGHAVPEGEELLLHWHISEPNLTATELDRLVDFMGALSDESFMPKIPEQVPSGLLH